MKHMKTGLKGISLLMAILVFCGCGVEVKQKEGELGDMKVRLEKLKAQKADIDKQIAQLEQDIEAVDTSFSSQTPKLVSLAEVKAVDFKHFLNLQGVVDAQNVSYVTPAGAPGQIKSILVKEGDRVSKGQLILRMDNSVAAENVNAIKQQLNTVNAQLDLARSVYQRQKNLWENNIGTEVQLLQAKTNVESLEGQRKAIQANVKAAEVQANQSNVYADVSGTIDEVTARVGETFSGNPAAGGYIKIVSSGSMKINVIIPENYASKVRKGTSVVVELPDNGKSFSGTISFLSQTIGASTRGFNAEVKVPSGVAVKPNQTVIVKIMDYHAPDVVSIPLNTVQNDETGKFVLTAVNRNGKLIAHKKRVEIGQFSGDSLEIKQGLEPGEKVIVEGFQNVFEGQLLTTETNGQ